MALCFINRGFAFGGKQYRKGKEDSITGEALAFAKDGEFVTVLIDDKPKRKKQAKKTDDKNS